MIECPLIECLDDIKIWCCLIVVFRCSWLLHRPEISIMVSFLGLTLWLCTIAPRPMYFISCLVSVYFLMFWYSRILTLINFMECFFSSALSKSFFKVKIRYGFNIGSKGSIHWEKIFSLLEGKISNGYKIDLFLVHKYTQNHRCSNIPKLLL